MLWCEYFVFSQNSYAEILTPKDDRIRRWSLWDVLGHKLRTLMNGISAFIQEAPESCLTPPARCRHGGKAPAVNQEEGGPHQKAIRLAP